jgi:hypothetical protein
MKIITLFFLISLISTSGHLCDNKEGLKKLVASSDIVALTEIIDVQDIGVGLWSGTGETKQYVTYQVTSILKGHLDSRKIKVAHLLYRNSLSVDSEKPQLSPKLFQEGKTLLLFINNGKRIVKGEQGNYFEEHEFVCFDVNCGALIPNPKLLKIVKKALS